MKLYVFSDGKRHGCYVYREEIPLEALERRGHTVIGGLDHIDQNADLLSVDAFIIPRLLDRDYPLVCDAIKRVGKPIIYEMDDAADLFERYHTSYFQVRNLLPSYYYLLHEADLVTTTTETLAAHFRRLGARRVEVLPNCPDPAVRWVTRPIAKTPRKIRIGFSGYTAHILDAAYWLEIMAALRQLREDFTPVLFGIAAKGQDGRVWMEKCKTAVNANPVPNYEFGQSLLTFRQAWLPVKDILEWEPMVDFDDYGTTLGDLRLDIGCCVLLDTPFNRCKSAVKFYDYAAAGAVTLASDVLPYSEEVELRVPNTLDSWVRLLSLLMDNAQHRQHRLGEQQAWIQQHRNADTWATTREDLYQSLLTPIAV